MKNLKIKLPHKEYPIMLQDGLIDKIPQHINEKYSGCKIAIVTDDNVNRYIGGAFKEKLDILGVNSHVIELPSGESSKSIGNLQRIYSEFISFGLSRSDIIIALGGGVVGDITGFAASTYLRGTRFIQIPTTLLAMVDSSVGGKVAVNLPEGKNLVGNFYHPEEVFIDPSALKTLPEKYFRDGMAEIIKYGCIADKDLFDHLLNDNKQEFMNSLEETILKCCKIKRDVVEEDELDTGWRMILNFGHTIGHALEKYYGYKKYTHGEAVAIGMVQITKISEEIGVTKKGTCEKIKNVLEKFNLPIENKDVPLKEIFKITTVDKKVKGKKINVIYIKDIGDVIIQTYNIGEWEEILG